MLFGMPSLHPCTFLMFFKSLIIRRRIRKMAVLLPHSFAFTILPYQVPLLQGRSHHVLTFGVELHEGMPPENLEGMRWPLRPFMGQSMLLGGHTTEFHMYEFYPFCPLRRTTLVSAFRPFAILTIDSCKISQAQMRLRDYNCLVGSTETCWKEAQISFSHCSQPPRKFHMLYMCALRGPPPTNGTNWRCQASHG